MLERLIKARFYDKIYVSRCRLNIKDLEMELSQETEKVASLVKSESSLKEEIKRKQKELADIKQKHTSEIQNITASTESR